MNTSATPASISCQHEALNGFWCPSKCLNMRSVTTQQGTGEMATVKAMGLRRWDIRGRKAVALVLSAVIIAALSGAVAVFWQVRAQPPKYISSIGINPNYHAYTPWHWAGAFAVVSIPIFIILAIIITSASYTWDQKKREVAARSRLQAAEARLAHAASESAESGADDGLALSSLWDVTHSRLDLYHQIATNQARRSFVTAQIAAALGFAALIAFAVLAARTRTTAGAVTAGALGAVSAALAGYIGRTFVRSQESAADHLRVYFDQPLEFSKFLAAERLMAGGGELTNEQRTAIITALVQAMVNPSAGSPTNGAA